MAHRIHNAVRLGARWLVAITVTGVLVGAPVTALIHQRDVDKLNAEQHALSGFVVQNRQLVDRVAESRVQSCHDSNIRWASLHALFASIPPPPNATRQQLTERAEFLTLLVPQDCSNLPKALP